MGERHIEEADFYREATELYAAALKADHHISLDAAHEIIAAALAEAERRGAEKEREYLEHSVAAILAHAKLVAETNTDSEYQAGQVVGASDALAALKARAST